MPQKKGRQMSWRQVLQNAEPNRWSGQVPWPLYGSFTGSWITEREGELVGLTSPFFLAALYLGRYVSDHLEIWTQILTFEAWDPHDSASPDPDNLGE